LKGVGRKEEKTCKSVEEAEEELKKLGLPISGLRLF
jgi:hypothetical protein